MLTSAPATPEAIDALVLRPQDLDEASVWFPGVAPKDLLKAAAVASVEALVFFEDGVPAGLRGYLVTDTACHPWLMCSERVHKHPKVVIRAGREWIAGLLKQYPGKLLCNYVDSTNTGALLLLKALGFVTVHAPGGGRFHFFFHPQSCAS